MLPADPGELWLLTARRANEPKGEPWCVRTGERAGSSSSITRLREVDLVLEAVYLEEP